MKTILEVIDLSTSFLKERGIERPKREAEDLIACALKLRRLDLYLQFERPLTEPELAAIRALIARRAKGEPKDYIIGEISFANVALEVTPAALIPRPETEILVEKIEVSDGKLLDLCTGSGAIAIALKKKYPNLEVTASDLSDAALQLAQKNSAKNNVQITFIKSDLFENIKEKFNTIVCNPPYVSLKEYQNLSREVHFEPKMAFIGGEDGLSFYRRLAQEIKEFLLPGGRAWLEIGSGQGDSVAAIFSAAGFNVEIEKDWAGLDRFCFLLKEI